MTRRRRSPVRARSTRARATRTTYPSIGVSRYTLTVRHGPKVDRASFGDLDDAVAALRRRAEEIQGEGPLPGVTMLREFEPGDRVAARLELSAKSGLLRRREAGVDVRGNGEIVGYAGAIAKRQLEPRRGESVFDALRRELSS